MRNILSFLLIAGIIVGCESAQTDQEATSDTLASDATSSFAFAGDFDGPLGIQLWSVRHEMEDDLVGTLEWVRDQGFQEVELHTTYGMSADSFRQVLDQVGIRATASHAGYERFQDDIEAMLDEAEVLGLSHVGIAWIPHPEDEPFSVERAREVAADFNEFGQAAADRGLRFFYHTHGYEFEPADDGTVPFDVLVDETNPEFVDFEMDVFWVAHPGADPVELLRQYPDRWSLMHVKDMAEGTESDYSGHAPPETNVPVGTGTIDYAAVLAAAEEIGMERYYIEDESPDPMGNIPESIGFLEQVTYSSR